MSSKSTTSRADQAWSSTPPGYPALAAFQSHATETTIFRRFRKLNSLNLLHLQTEMFLLENELQDRWSKDMETVMVEKLRIYKSYKQLREKPGDEYDDLRNLMDRLRKLTKEYNKALLLYNQVLVVESPSERPLKALKDWLAYYDRPLKDPAGARYLDPDDEDPVDELVALGAEGQQKDFLTNFIFDNSARFLRSGNKIKVVKDPENPRNESHVFFFSRTHAEILVTVVKLTLAMILLFGAIICLYFTRSDVARLGLLGGFTVLFCLTLLATTTASRGEMFGATAAYAAVLVVFISGDISSGG